MKNVIQKILRLKAWSSLDIEFSNILNLSTCSKYKNNIKEALMLASLNLSASVRSGHTCFPLRLLSTDKLFQGYNLELARKTYKKLGKPSINDWQELLLSCSAVSDGSRVTPLVLENECLYLYRMWKDECTVAQFFNYKNKSNDFQKEKIVYTLNQLFPISYTEVDWHKIATAISITHQRVLISGGPGTGKTSTAAKIIAALLLYSNNDNLHIKMAAPTGKAAARLTESFKKTINNISQLNGFNLSNLPEKAITLHSLVGTRLHQRNIQHNHLNPINLDILIVDEASMVSLSILAQLILVISPQTKVIFFGDHNQLCSIEPGSVFKDMCQFSNICYSIKRRQELMDLTGYTLPNASPLKSSVNYNHNNITDGTCILNKNYRFSESSGINQLANAINSGNYNRTISLLHANIYKDLNYIQFIKKENYITMLTDCSVMYSDYLKKIKCTKIKVINILKIFDNYRILCALRDGPFGITKINYYIEHILNEKGLIQLRNFNNYIGRPIIILRNKPSLELYNGDVGIFLPNNQNKLSAYFLSPQDNVKIIQIHQLPEHETCFAMTIHKTQGSEFQNVAIVLPTQHFPILTRELLYTAVTRARQYLVLYATDHVIINSINLITQRYSGLYERIKKNMMLIV